MSISAVVSSASAVSSAISMTSVTGLAIGGVLATVLLILLLSSKEIISASSYWNYKIANAFNTVIVPLLFVFASIVAFKILEVV